MASEKCKKKSADDEIEYDVLQTPSSITFENIEFEPSYTFEDGFQFYHIYVTAHQLKEICLPTDANPREPTLATVVREMQETIQITPEKFHHLNNGISVICDNVTYEGGDHSLTITFREGDGICNGGHTYFSIVTFPGDIDAKCLVQIELIELPKQLEGTARKEIVNDIASARNKNRALLPTTEADYLGLYNNFKDWLGDNKKFVSWHEGDSEAHSDSIRSDHFIRLLASIDPYWFQHPQITASDQRSTHKFAATGVAAVHSKWFGKTADSEGNLYHLAPLANEIFKIRDTMSFSLKYDSFTGASRIRGTNFYQWVTTNNKSVRKLYFGKNAGKDGVKFPATFDVLLVGALRHNVWIGLDVTGNPNYIGVLEDPLYLWESAKISLLEKLKSLFASFDNDPAQFCRKDASYDLQLIDILYGMRPPKVPRYFYDLTTKERYIKQETDPSHYLQISDGKYANVAEVGSPVLPEGTTGYKKEA